jgi:hypothetical protein
MALTAIPLLCECCAFKRIYGAIGIVTISMIPHMM